MKPEPYEFVHLAIMARGGRISGKTKMQKTVYFLGVLADYLDPLGYGPHYYGPYSGVVAEAVDRLKTIGVLEQETLGLGAVDSQGFEVRRYDYHLNEAGRRLGQAKARKYPGLWRKMQDAAEIMQNAGDPDYLDMSVAAKTYFMLGQRKGAATDEQLADLAARFGWHVTEEQVHKAGEYLSKLQLVEVKET